MSDHIASGSSPVERSNETCPNCGEQAVETRVETDTVDYAADSGPVQLKVDVPVRKCSKCGFEYLDIDAQTARHEAVCRHLGLLTPVEIERIRKFYGLSRPAFCDITKIGEASLGRWERGAKIQNAAYDQFLYLLQVPENLERLRRRNSGVDVSGFTICSTGGRAKFRCMEPTELDRAHASGFRLVVAA